MISINEIVYRVIPPVPFAEGDNIPWNEPGFSERMLKEHLSQEHDLASRKFAKVELQTDWIFKKLITATPKSILDLGCGPGFYTCALARKGCECEGIDFSPASVRYANETATEEGLSCRHHLADLRDGGFGEGFDLAMLLYGQINVFERSQAKKILKAMWESLSPGGTLLLEPQTHSHVFGNAESTNSWYTSPSGLFSDAPHLVLQEGSFDNESGVRTERFFVTNAATGEVTQYALPTVAYQEQEIIELLSSIGFESLRVHPSLLGEADPDCSSLYVVSGRKPR